MTTHAEKRCAHCQVRYYYQSSGWGFEDFNDARYCPECMEIVSKALKDIPEKVEKDWVPISEVFGEEAEIDVDTLLQWERERKKETRDNGGLYCQRVAFPLFDITGKRREHSGIVYGRGEKLKGFVFEYRYWTCNKDSKSRYAEDKEIREDITISVEMERDLVTGQLSKWKYLS